jgi:hypothetical protein
MALDARALAPTSEPRGDAAPADVDPAYPTVSLVDALYPAQTRAFLPPPLDGIATPSMWARLAEPLRRVLAGAWRELGLQEGGEPALWVTIHYGRIALNAHGCERLRAVLCERAPDPALVVPATGLGRLAEAWERRRARRRRQHLERRVGAALPQRDALLEPLVARDPAALDSAVLARGPLDDARWTELLLPLLVAALETGEAPKDPVLDAALALEQRWATELGQRLVAARVLPSPAAVAYLTVDERVRAVLMPQPIWNERAEQRAARVRQFAALELPIEFWGRPRAS